MPRVTVRVVVEIRSPEARAHVMGPKLDHKVRSRKGRLALAAGAAGGLRERSDRVFWGAAGENFGNFGAFPFELTGS